MFVLRILLNGQNKSRDNILSHTAVATDSCHRRMDPCRPRAVNQPAEGLTARANNIIDRSTARTPSRIGYTPAKLRTDETVDHGSAEQTIEINQNVLAGTFILTEEITTRTTPETYGIAGTCPTDSRTEGRTVRVMDYPILLTQDTAEDPILSTEVVPQGDTTGPIW